MILHALALATQLARCAPHVAPSTMTAIVSVESGGDPYAIGDNTAGRSYHLANRASAQALARRLLAAGHSLDLGIAQIDDVNLANHGQSVDTIFDPCENLRTGAAILANDYTIAARHFGTGQVALRHAIGMYNTGQLNGGASYIRHVLAAAGIRERYTTNRHVASRRTLHVDWKALTLRKAMSAPMTVAIASSQAAPTLARPPNPRAAPILIADASSIEPAGF